MPWNGVLKLIGIALFVWIAARIDRAALLETARSAHPGLLVLSLAILLSNQSTKALRWWTVLRGAAVPCSFGQAWGSYWTSAFLATLTPGRVGEFSRAVHLRHHGLPLRDGVLLSLLDRLADAAVIGLLSLGAMGLLVGRGWMLTGTGFAAVAAVAAGLSLRRWKSRLPSTPRSLLRTSTVTGILVVTLGSWVLYFAWAVALARSLGIGAPLLPFVAALTITGVIALLPIAPTGLGTREAALIALLAPYGVAPEQAVALGLYMFTSIVASTLPGLYLWLTRPDALDENDRRRGSMKSWTFQDVARHWDSQPDYDALKARIDSYLRHFQDTAPLFAINPGDRVLDIDCRTGNGTVFFAQRQPRARFTCIAMASSFERRSKARFREHGIDASLTHLTGLPLALADASFDVVLCYETLEHVPDPGAFILELSRVLRPGGTLVLTTPNRLWEPVHWLSEKLKFDHGEGPHRMLPRREILAHLGGAGLAGDIERTAVLVPAGPRWLLQLGRALERALPESMLRALALRRMFICHRHPPHQP